MKKLISLLVFFALFSGMAHANTKITQMPGGGDTATGDLVPVVRGGVNLKTTYPAPGAAPAGSPGAFQTYGTSTSFTGLLPPAAMTAISSGIFVDPRDTQFGSNTCTGYYGINASSLVSGGSGYAVNDTFKVATAFYGANQAVGHVTGISGGGTITSYVIDSPGGAYVQKVGQTLTTVATSGVGSGLTISITSSLTTGNDDTAAFVAAGTYAQSVGGALLVPNGCWVANLILPSGVTMMGMGLGPSYAFTETTAGSTLPKLFVIGNPTYVINMNGAFDQAFVGFEINGFGSGGPLPNVCLGGDTNTGGFNGAKEWIYKMAFKGCNIGVGQQASASGQLLTTIEDSDFAAFSDSGKGISGHFSDSVFWNNTFVGGTAIEMLSGAFGGTRIFGNRIEFSAYGIVLTGGSGGQIVNNQFDHQKYCQILLNGGGTAALVEGNSFRGGGVAGSLYVTNAVNNGSGAIRLTVANNMDSFGASVTSGLTTGDIASVVGVGGVPNATGTWTITVINSTTIDLQGTTFAGTFTSGGSAAIRGKSSDICLANTGGVPPTSSYFSFRADDNLFGNSQTGFTTHPSPAYVLEVLTTGTSNNNVAFMGGQAFPQNPLSASTTIYNPSDAYFVNFDHWVNGVAPDYVVQGLGGTTAFSNSPTSLGYGLSNGALSLLTTTPTTGTVFDALSATGTANSSIGLPSGTNSTRPTTGVPGMLRYNSDTPAVEAYYAGTWNTLGSSAGTGTVTSMSITTTNGISGTVATPTTTPAVSLVLGAITPTSVNGETFSATTTGALVSNGTGVITSTILDNTYLTNSSVTISPGTGIAGGGSVALGSTITVSALQASTTVLGSVIVGSGLAISTTGVLSATSTGSGSSAFSALTAATVSNTIDNLNFPNNWNWTTLTSGNALTLTATASASGAVLKAVGNVVLGLGSITTSATDGFVYIPSSAGIPIGTPTAQSGYVPMEFDATDNRLYIYNSGWSGLGTSLSSLVAATSTNALDSNNLAQTWAWGTLSSENALTLTSSSITSGKVLNVTANNVAGTGSAGYFSTTATAGFALTTSGSTFLGGTTTVSGKAIANSFTPTSSTIPTDGLYLIGSNSSAIADNTKPVLQTTGVASGVDYLGVTNAATAATAAIVLTSTGTDSNINMQLMSTGTGGVAINGANFGSSSMTINEHAGATGNGLTIQAIAGINNGNSDFALKSSASGTAYYWDVAANGNGSAPTTNAGGVLAFYDATNNKTPFAVWANSANGSLVVSDGKVGVNLGSYFNTTPATTLEVNGTIRADTALQVGTKLTWSATAPTISSGFGTSPSIVTANGTAAFTLNVGTGGSATSGVIGLPTATTGWNCRATDNTNDATIVTSCVPTSTTSATCSSYSRTTGVSAAWTASDVLGVSCVAY